MGALLFYKMNKSEILTACLNILNQKIEQVKVAIEDSNLSLKEDTKSSAGDKYETSREMIQQDLNRYEQQLRVLNIDMETLNRIQSQQAIPSTVAALGSIIQTNQATYFLAISIGLITVDNLKIFSISTASPIGKILVGKSVGQRFEFNGIQHQIIAIY